MPIHFIGNNKPYNIDSDPHNADWLRMTWTLPPYKSPEFMDFLKKSGWTLDQFKQLPIYKNAVRKGLIKNDEWVGDKK